MGKDIIFNSIGVPFGIVLEIFPCKIKVSGFGISSANNGDKQLFNKKQISKIN